MDTVVERTIFEFSAKFCNELDKNINLASSPLVAAEIIMAMMELKCNEFTWSPPVFSNNIQITDRSIIPSSYLLLSPSLKSVRGVKLKRASKLCLHKSNFKTNSYMKKTAFEVFNLKVEVSDLRNSDNVIKTINKWIEKKTKKIKWILNYDNFNVETSSIILVSGLYFKGIWQMKFDPEDTEETIFYLNNNETVNVFLMYRKEKYKYKESSNLEAQMVLLPFKNEEAQMLIVLPKRITGLDSILQKLAEGYDLMAEMALMNQTVEVEVNVPRFTVESEINLTEVFNKLGIHTTFDKAVQKVFIEVNEEGTEPKPKKLMGSFIPRWKPRPTIFMADRPFLVVILCHNVPIIWVTFRGRFDK